MNADKRNSLSISNLARREGSIRDAVAEMNELLHEKNRVRDRIRALTARINKELDIAAGDFIMGVRLAKMAEKKDTQTLNSVREILLALGNTIPAITAPQEPAPAPQKPSAPISQYPATKKLDVTNGRCGKIRDYIATHGEIKAAVARKALGFDPSVYLTWMKRAGVVEHNAETATWRLAPEA